MPSLVKSLLNSFDATLLLSLGFLFIRELPTKDEIQFEVEYQIAEMEKALAALKAKLV